jgi:hypothetical protein
MRVRRFGGRRCATHAFAFIGLLACGSCAAVSGLDGLKESECVRLCDGALGGAGGDGSLVGSAGDGSSPSDSTATAVPASDGQSVESDGSLDAISSDAPRSSDAENAGGSDAAGSAIDTGQDASDGSVAPVVTFANPLSIDVHSLLVSNTVVTTASGGAALTSADGASGNDFLTHSAAIAKSPSGIGLADDAFFPSNGPNIPNVQLAWTNARNVANSLVIPVNTGISIQFDVPPGKYAQLQIYAMGTNGTSTLTITLTYAVGNAAISTVTVPDWCTGTLGAGEYTLAKSQRVNGTRLDATLCSIYALDFNPDPTRVLKTVAFVAHYGGHVVFYGATAW